MAAIERPVDLLRELVRIDTSNPPGNEGPCIDLLEGVLQAGGFHVERAARDPRRPNLIARRSGAGRSPALLFCGHVDVVPADPGAWSHPPFSGDLDAGYVWGRGTLDMKGGVAMMVSAAVRAAREGITMSGDLVLAIVADEESGGAYGARFLVEERPELLSGVRFAISEFGGFPMRVAGRTFLMIQVAEKLPLVVDVTVRGPTGHGSRPLRGAAMARLGRILARLETQRFPIHLTSATRAMVEAFARALPRSRRLFLRQLLHPRRAAAALASWGDAGRTFEPLFRNTVSATLVRGGERLNVIPGEIHLGLDARLLPGCSVDTFREELDRVVRQDGEVAVTADVESLPEPDLSLFPLLGQLLRERDRNASPAPFLLPASSDARHLTRCGIQTYGFTPMNLAPGVEFFASIHSVDERIPADAVEFGADVLFDLLRRYEA